MSHWNFWEWLGFATIWVAAIVVAIDTAVKQAPTLRAKLAPVLESAWWGFTPLAAIFVGTVIFLLEAAGATLPDLPKTILPGLALAAAIGFTIAVFVSLRSSKLEGFSGDTRATIATPPAKPHIEIDGSWYSSVDIILLSQAKFRKQWAEVKQKADALELEALGLEREKAIISAKAGPLAALQFDPDSEYGKISVKISTVNQDMYSELRKLDALKKQMMDDIYGCLSSGILISKGFRPPVNPADDEVPIPAAQWRLLRFDRDLNNAEGGGISYIGIAVGLPKVHAPPITVPKMSVLKRLLYRN